MGQNRLELSEHCNFSSRRQYNWNTSLDTNLEKKRKKTNAKSLNNQTLSCMREEMYTVRSKFLSSVRFSSSFAHKCCIYLNVKLNNTILKLILFSVMLNFWQPLLFNAKRSFRNHSNIPNWCPRNIFMKTVVLPLIQ